MGKPEFPEPSIVPINIPAVVNPTDRLDALLALVDTFPRTKMLEAVTAQEAIAAEEAKLAATYLEQACQSARQ